jgi:hypothetical protein
MYKIIFTDNEEFVGGDFLNSKWNEIPDKPIKKIEYNFGDKKITLEDYNMYNHLVERVRIHQVGDKITSIQLMAKKDDAVLVLIFEPLTNKLNYKPADFGREYKNKPTTGWKKGIENGKPKCNEE